jgi:hypothetical protein
MQRFCIAVSLLISACAGGGANRAPTTTTGTPDPAAINASTESDVTCTDEVRTGTHMEKKVCRSQNEKDQDRKAAQDLILDPNSRPAFR